MPDEARIGLRHRFVEANGLRFHVVEAGSGPLVLLLHGFPEFWYGWRNQIPALARHFRVVAPDLRGYNLTDKPATGYDYETLVGDVPALIRALGAERAHVVGHDWGGMPAWGAAAFRPDVVDRLVIMNSPHPKAYQREMLRNPRQWLSSWYIGLIQIPGLPDWLLRRDHARLVRGMLRSAAAEPTAFSGRDIAAYRRAMLRPGAIRATLAYYRAMFSRRAWALTETFPTIQAPTLLIWGQRDVALVPELANGLDAWVPRIRVERIPEAGHFVQHDRPAQVSSLILDHLTASASLARP